MTFGGLKDAITEYLTLEGWSNTSTPPVAADLANAALAQFSWMGQYLRGSADITMVAGTHTYSLTATTADAWARVTACAWTDGAGELDSTSEEVLSVDEPTWFVAASGTPRMYWCPKPGYIRVYPTPASSGKVLRVIGSRCEPTLSATDGVIVAPLPFHDAIAQLGAALHAQKYAVSDAQQAKVSLWKSNAESAASELRATMNSDRLPFTRRLRLSGSPRVRV